VLGALFLGPLKTLLVGVAIFVPFERLATLHSGQRTFRRGWATDVLTGLANGVLLYAVLLAALGLIDAAAASIASGLRSWIETRPLWAQALIAIAVGDLGVYAVHRLQHTHALLWRFHAIHHSADELDWLVGSRFHPIDLFLLRVASIGPLVAIHLTPAAIGIFIVVSGWQGWLVHANVRVLYGPLRWLWVSPEFHHWHHSADREAYDKNYASLVALWDVLFGTVHLPSGARPDRYGIDERVPAGYAGRLVQPFRSRERAPDPSSHAHPMTTPAPAP
jgi:sterol desaturase/sphingolipid hydroxylase (fatty acid hydroxylase superfamily)